MGYIKHDAIIVTSCDEKYLSPAMAKAEALGLSVSPIVKSQMNGYVSFLIAPDGSKEGWHDSEDGDAARDAWKAWAREQYMRSNLLIDWVHLAYAGDEASDTRIVEQGKL